MNEIVNQALQGGKANPKMKTIWMLKWSARYIFLLIFLMFFIFFRIFVIFFIEDIIMLLVICIILPILLGFFISFIWAILYWERYNFKLESERVKITRGVIGKRVTNIPYERIQNVNIYRGVLDRIFGLYSIQIETAGGFNIRSTGGYGTMMTSEGSIQGLTNPEPLADFILAKAKGKQDGLGDIASKKELSKDEKISLLEERLINGEISEKTYEDLKRKYMQE